MEATKVVRVGILVVLVTCWLSGCRKSDHPVSNMNASERPEFKTYWHAGKAEINTYTLTQSRYGESRKGKAVLIFVTEDLSKKKQVKGDDLSYRHKVNVMKLNFMKNFVTGIYPYSMMLSVFTPVNLLAERSTLKVAMSVQEWCGQVYTQMNLRGNRYAIKSHSYFEQEADQAYSVRQELLEDEIWNQIRLDHTSLPTGKVDVIPGLFFTRLQHAELKVLSAIAEKSQTDSTNVFTLKYAAHDRELAIHYEKNFPFRIQMWRETWKQEGNTMQTLAVFDKSLYSDYWTKNKNEFQYLRDSLNLPREY